MADLDATSTLYLSDETNNNDGRPVYDVCTVGTRDAVGTVWLGPDDKWHIDSVDGEAWVLVVDAVRRVMQNRRNP